MTENRNVCTTERFGIGQNSRESEIEKKSVMNLLETAEDQRTKHPLPIHTYTIYHLSVPNDW